MYARPATRVERLTYTRRQAAEALGVSLSTIDRRVAPVLDTFFNDQGMRLIPVDELKRYIAENRRMPERSCGPASAPADARTYRRASLSGFGGSTPMRRASPRSRAGSTLTVSRRRRAVAGGGRRQSATCYHACPTRSSVDRQ